MMGPILDLVDVDNVRRWTFARPHVWSEPVRNPDTFDPLAKGWTARRPIYSRWAAMNEGSLRKIMQRLGHRLISKT